METFSKKNKEISKDNKQIGLKIIKRKNIELKWIDLEEKRDIFIFNEKQKEQGRIEMKNHSIANKYFNNEHNIDKKQKEEKNISCIIKIKNSKKDIISNEKINSKSKANLIKQNTKYLKANYFIRNIIKFVVHVLIYKILFFSLINNNKNIIYKFIFFHFHIKKEFLLLLYIIIVFNIIIILEKIKYNKRKKNYIKYFKLYLKYITEKLCSFSKNCFDIMQNNKIKDRIVKYNEKLITYNNIIKSQMKRNRKNNISGNITNVIILKFLIKGILIIDIFNQIFLHNIINLLPYHLSNITLKIKGIGSYEIFEESFFSESECRPNEIYINGNRTDIIAYKYYFNQNENYVELIWHNNINTCKYMFRNCYKISEINISSFDTSKITDMGYMFDSCWSLSSLDLSNFNTSLVENMESMFCGCVNLEKLNISSFDTSKVTNMGYMFGYCSSLTSLDLSNFDTSIVENMESMFSGCINLEKLNISSFDTSKVTNMGYMFEYCSSLTSLDLSNFDTSIVEYMEDMFSSCINLEKLNISKFDTSKVIYMSYMFSYCKSLTSLDLLNFNTSLVKDMEGMFMGLWSLTEIYLSNFDTSKVINMGFMFSSCLSLTSLDLSNFNTSLVKYMVSMFKKCLNLKYINLKNFVENEFVFAYDMFANVSENVVICLNEGDKILNETKNKCITIDCSDDWKLKQKKIINDTNECIESCENSLHYKYEYNGKCYKNCSSGYLYDENNSIINKCKCENDNHLLCTQKAVNKGLCMQCNISYYPIEDSQYNIDYYDDFDDYYDDFYDYYDDFYNYYDDFYDFNHFFRFHYNFFGKDNYFYYKCYKEPKGYFLDKNNLLYRKCYYTCESCKISGNNATHNCLECNNNYEFGIKINNYMNCYQNCSYYYFFDIENRFHCTNNYSCPQEYPQLIESKKECVKYNIQNIINDKEKLINETENISKEKEEEYYNDVINTIKNIFESKDYDTSNIDNGGEDIIETNRMKIIMAKIENQKNIDFGECENLLRKYYNISNNISLYLETINVIQKGMNTSKIGYDIFCKLFEKNLIKLNLTACENSKISLKIPIVITENLDKLNSSSGYYNDICYTATSKDGTDISFKDRKKEFSEDNRIVCQEDCEFSKYDYDTFTAECLCKVKESSSSKFDININKNKLLDNMKDIKNFANLNFLVCHKNLLNKNGIRNNIGCYAILVIIFFNFLTIFIFYRFQFPLIKNKIKDIVFGIIEYHKIKQNKNRNKMRTINKYENNKTNKQRKNITSSKILIKTKKKKKRTMKKNIAIINLNNNFIYGNKKNMNDINRNITTNIICKNGSVTKLYANPNQNVQDKVERVKKIMEYIDEEINLLSYNLALQYDKRSFCQYYISLLKTKHNLIFAFCNNNDYNSKIIKIDLFFIGFAVYYTVNGLFYNDDTMHNIYKRKGKFNLEEHIPIIIYSFLISTILNTLLNLLALSNDAIISFKQNTKINLDKRKRELIDKLKIRFILFFIISFLFLSFFWYYISMFGVIYKNTQLHLLKDTLISFGLSLLYPFGIFLLPGFFRIPSLSNRKNKREYLYNLSKVVQLL